MSNNVDMLDKRHVLTKCEEEYSCKVRRNDHGYRKMYEYDKKMKREIANSNERRRMQSINLGFETLKRLLPITVEGEKLSKASILQLTAKYIQSLQNRLTNLENQVTCYKKNLLNRDKISQNKSLLSSSTIHDHNRKRRLQGSIVDLEAIMDNSDSPTSIISPTFTVLSSETCLVSCSNSEKPPGSLEHLVAAIEQVEGERFYAKTDWSISQQNLLIKSEPSDLLNLSSVETQSFERSFRLESVDTLSHSTSCSEALLSNINNTNNANKDNKRHNSHFDDNSVIKPTISPYTEKIILAVTQLNNNRNHCRNISVLSPSSPSSNIGDNNNNGCMTNIIDDIEPMIGDNDDIDPSQTVVPISKKYFCHQQIKEEVSTKPHHRHHSE